MYILFRHVYSKLNNSCKYVDRIQLQNDNFISLSIYSLQMATGQPLTLRNLHCRYL